MALEIRQMRYIVEVADRENFSRAAEFLGIAQSALSQQILKVERELGIDLFHRHPRGATVTPAGQPFVDDARAAVAAFDDAVSRASRRARGETGRLNLGFVGGAALELVPSILSAFYRRYPEVDLRLQETGLSDPSAGLGDGVADVAFLRLPVATTGLWSEVLREESRVIAVSSTHPLATRDEVSAAEILDEPLIKTAGRDRASSGFWLLEEFRDGHAAPVVAEAETIETKLHLVASGRGCSVTYATAAQYHPRPGVVYVPIVDAPPSQIVVAHRAGEAEPIVHNFVAVAVEVGMA